MAKRTAPATFSAQTRAALLPQPARLRFQSAGRFLDEYLGRGYNTVVLPYLSAGRLAADAAVLRTSRAPVVNLLNASLGRSDCSVWLYVDFLSAGPAGTGRLSRLARRHREWLMRNAAGQTLPLGRDTTNPLFSWVNDSWRRYLGDTLVRLAESYPFSGIVFDLRRLPLPAENPDHLFCCSFRSQERAEAALGLRFEYLLTEADRQSLLDWQQWIAMELRHFTEYMKARVGEVRRDIGWKALVPPPGERPTEHCPWYGWVRDGLMGELIVERTNPQRPWREILAATDGRTGEHRYPVLPAFSWQDEVARHSADLAGASSPGFLVLDPDLGHGRRDEKPAPLPMEAGIQWSRSGALEDYPPEAVAAYLEHVVERLGSDSNLGRFYRRVLTYLPETEFDVTTLERVLDSLRRMEAKLREGDPDIEFLPDQQPMLREISLAGRMASLIEPPPVAIS